MKKIWKGKNKKTENLENVVDVAYTQHNLKENKTIIHNVGAHCNVPVKMNNKLKRTRIIVPLIVMLVLICIIAVICVGEPFGRPSETAEINRNVEQNEGQILAETTTLTTGQTYTVPEDGLYKIEMYGGNGANLKLKDGTIIPGYKGKKATFHVRLYEKSVLNTVREKASDEVQITMSDGCDVDATSWVREAFMGSDGVSLELMDEGKILTASGAPGLARDTNIFWCPVCGDWYALPNRGNSPGYSFTASYKGAKLTNIEYGKWAIPACDCQGDATYGYSYRAHLVRRWWW